ncbi:MAG: NifB/NifX family molybdenum-iron cluster-binding protein [Sulfuricurvum sp.]
MILSLPIKSARTDATLAPLFGNAKHFAFVDEEGVITTQPMEQNGGKDVARTLLTHNVDVLIVSHLGLNPFVLLKTYGIKVYFGGEKRMTISQAVAAFHEDKLVEVTAENYEALLGSDHHASHSHTHNHSIGCGCGGHHVHA